MGSHAFSTFSQSCCFLCHSNLLCPASAFCPFLTKRGVLASTTTMRALPRRRTVVGHRASRLSLNARPLEAGVRAKGGMTSRGSSALATHNDISPATCALTRRRHRRAHSALRDALVEGGSGSDPLTPPCWKTEQAWYGAHDYRATFLRALFTYQADLVSIATTPPRHKRDAAKR